VALDVPYSTLTRVAGEYSKYRVWALEGINGNGERDFITLLRDVRFQFRPRSTVGFFVLRFDVDLVWPFGSQGNQIRFAVRGATPSEGGGVRDLHLGLLGENIMIDDFDVRLVAEPAGAGSVVRFRSRVRFDGFFDTFLSMSRYKRNVEWRIVKVIKNLKAYVEAK